MTPKSSVPPRFQHHRHRGDREEMDAVQQAAQGMDRIRVDSEESETNKVGDGEAVGCSTIWGRL